MIKKITYTVCTFFLVSCGLYYNQPVEREAILDGVKQISPSITRGEDATAFSKKQYELDSQTRLLVRFEKPLDNAEQLHTTSKTKASLQFACSDPNCNGAQPEDVGLCALERDWMMLATWTHAHPFGNSGKWTAAGGDFEEKNCVYAEEIKFPDPTDTHGKPLWSFAIGQWIIDRAVGHGNNFGWVLVSKVALQLEGEKSIGYAPRIFYNESMPVFEYTPPKPKKSGYTSKH